MVRRKCIVTMLGPLFFVLSILLGVKLLPTLPVLIKNNIDRLFGAIAAIGLIGLWAIVIYKNRTK